MFASKGDFDIHMHPILVDLSLGVPYKIVNIKELSLKGWGGHIKAPWMPHGELREPQGQPTNIISKTLEFNEYKRMLNKSKDAQYLRLK